MSEEDVLSRLSFLASAEKVSIETPDWVVDYRAQGNRIRISCPLSIRGVVQEGLRLELHAPQAVTPARPFKDLAALLIVGNASKTMLLGRIEFDPSPVEGPNHRNPIFAKDLPPKITGPHIHSFHLNARRGMIDLNPKENLPLAAQLVSTFSTFDEILEIIDREFNIVGLWLGEPKWHQLLV